MRRRYRYLYLIIFLILVNSLIYCHYPRSDAFSLFAKEGLLLDGAGALLILLPDLPLFEKLTTKNDDLKRLNSGSDTLLVEENGLWRSDEGFEEVFQVIEHMSDVETDPVAIWPRMPGGVGAGGDIHLIPEEKTEDGEVQPGPQDCENVASQRVVENWVNQEFEKQSNKNEYPLLRTGALLLVLGFSLQFVGSLA